MRAPLGVLAVRAPLGVLVLVRAPLGVLLRIFLYTIFLVAIVLSNNYDSPRGHQYPNARWPRKFAKAGREFFVDYRTSY